jgi:hypothetical protein
MTEGCCKVGRVIEAYDLAPGDPDYENMDDYLIARWRGDAEGEAIGYRSLADHLNKRLLRTTSIEAGRQVTRPHIESEYEALRGDDTESRVAIETALEGDGVDVEALESAFVSHMALRRHFKECLGEDKDHPTSNTDWRRDSIDYATTRFQDTIEEICQSLARSDRVPDAEQAQLQTPIFLSCPECPTRVRLETALDDGYVCETHGLSG